MKFMFITVLDVFYQRKHCPQEKKDLARATFTKIVKPFTFINFVLDVQPIQTNVCVSFLSKQAIKNNKATIKINVLKWKRGALAKNTNIWMEDFQGTK